MGNSFSSLVASQIDRNLPTALLRPIPAQFSHDRRTEAHVLLCLRLGSGRHSSKPALEIFSRLRLAPLGLRLCNLLWLWLCKLDFSLGLGGAAVPLGRSPLVQPEAQPHGSKSPVHKFSKHEDFAKAFTHSMSCDIRYVPSCILSSVHSTKPGNLHHRLSHRSCLHTRHVAECAVSQPHISRL